MRSKASRIALLALSGCAGMSAPAPAPEAPLPLPPIGAGPSERAVAAVIRDNGHPSNKADSAAPALKPLPDADPALPIAVVAFETPYKLGAAPEPRSQAEYAERVAELRHWNRGGTGALLGDMPGPIGHPDPRVTIDVGKVAGPHHASDILRLARRNHWIHVVRCYRLGAYKDRELRGWTHAVMSIARGGQVRKPRLLRTDLPDRAVADCMVAKLSALDFPPATRPSEVWIDMRVGPGDEPMPPPQDLIVPGDGTLSPEQMLAGARAGVPAFEACYRAAFGYAPGLWGRMLLRLHLDKRGKLDEAFEAGTHFPDARVSQCVVHAGRALHFDRPDGGEIRFVVPLRLFSDRSGQ